MIRIREQNYTRHTEKTKWSKGLQLFFVVTTIVFVSRLPFIDNLHAGTGDAPFIIPTAWALQLAPPILLNCTSAFLCAIGVALFALSVKAMDGMNSVLSGLALACVPAVYINSITSADFLWAFPFLMASLYLVLLERPLFAGACLGLAISSHMTVVTMIIPLCLLLARGGMDSRKLRHLLVFLAPSALVVVLLSFADSTRDKWNFLNYKPCGFPVKLIIKSTTIELWGAVGTVALAAAAFSLFFRKSKAENRVSLPTASKHRQVVASMAAIILYLSTFAATPIKASYLIPIAPFVILFLGGVLGRMLFGILCWVLVFSPFFVTLRQASQEPKKSSDFSCAISFHNRRLYIDFLQGPILFAHAQRKAETRLLEGRFSRGVQALSGLEQLPMWVTGYYPVWSLGLSGTGVNPMHPKDVNWSGITHVVHFGVGPQTVPPYWSPMVKNLQGNRDSLDLVHAGSWVYPAGSYNMPDSLHKYTLMNGARLVLSCGGIWGDQGTAMSFITQDSSRTQTFVDALLGFAQRHGYDGGIEIDWESSVTRDGMSRLVRIMTRGLRRWSPRGELIIAVVNGLEDKYEIALKDSVDQYNIMLYDMHGSTSLQGGVDSWSDVTAFDAPLYPPSSEFPTLRRWNWNYDGTLDGIGNVTSPRQMITRGWPAAKLGMGVPFVGFVYAGRLAPNQFRNCSSPQYVSAIDVEYALQHGGVRHWEDSAKVPWIGGIAEQNIGWMVKAGEQFYITYDDMGSLRLKVEWAKKLGLGGIMIYDLWSGWISTAPVGQKDPLLQSVLRAVRGSVF
jgi:GH18 family chitinase